MPQLFLPLIPQGATRINDRVSVVRDENRWTYFVDMCPIYFHDSRDQNSFRLITSQLIESGACRQVEIINTFGVSKNSVIRSLNKLRQGGSEAFFRKRQGRRGGHVLTPEVMDQAQQLLDKGIPKNDVAEEIGIKADTLRKAIEDGRLRSSESVEASAVKSLVVESPEIPTNKSSRSETDAKAAEVLGTACTRMIDRVFASFGKIDGTSVQFEKCLDVPNGGVLCALPALLTNGLLEGAEQILGKIKGYYTMIQILLLLAFMSLCRIKTIEQLRGHAPGEFGKLIGLDRIPEVRCLREKMDVLSTGDSAEKWSAHLSKHWMKSEPESVGTLYIDSHVRVYHGRLTKPPRRFVSRERLCLRGITDYWVNDTIGRPFFVVEKPIDPGLVKTLEADIVPRLLQDIPHQPTDSELKENPHQSRFVMVFDREGYSPAFFARMWENHRIACMTYHKYPSEDWPEERFVEHEVRMPRGEIVKMRLAEMKSLIGSGKKGIWVREVRKLTDSGHQTSLISTGFDFPHIQLAAWMFGRWSQENFFQYAMKHFAIDLLLEYGTAPFPETEKVINPRWRELNKSKNSLVTKLKYRRSRFAEMTMHPMEQDESKNYEKWLKKKANLLEDIDQLEHQVNQLKSEIKTTLKHIEWKDLDKKDQFHRLLPGRKRLMDTIRMIAYRAETAMAGLLTGPTVDTGEARKLLQDLFVTEADILPDLTNNRLVIRVHGASRPVANRLLKKLFDHLNESELEYPTTNLRLVYELIDGEKADLVPPHFPRDQES